LLQGATLLYTALLGNQEAPPDAASVGQSAFYLGAAFVILALPTGLMGATLPLLTRYAVRAQEQVGPRVALLYGLNTGGAVFGAVTAGFVLLPWLGLRGTVWVGVGVNALVFLIAARLARRLPAETPPAGAAVEPAPAPLGVYRACLRPLVERGAPFASRLRRAWLDQPAWILPLMLISGANAFFYEVLWTRLINHVLGGSIYAFATMLASFLTGIAVGGGLAGRFARDRTGAALAFAIVQVGIGALSAAVYHWMEQAIPSGRGLWQSAAFAAVVLLPATFFIGATLPLAVRILSRDEREAAVATARTYAWNTVGAIAGSILAGFFIIPSLGFEGSIRLAVVINLALALATLALVAPLRVKQWVPAALATALIAVAYHPARPAAVLSASGFPGVQAARGAEELYFAVGRSSTVLLMEDRGWVNLRTNGLPEASIDAKGAPPSMHSQRWLTALPVAARPAAKSVLIIGFGGGMAVEGTPPSVAQIDVIELEPKVIEANRRIAAFRGRDPLADPRVRIVLNDARNALRLTSKRYDVVVSQPSHPWTAAASHLFSREFMQQAADHLQEGGVFVQWMNSEFIDVALFKTLAATLIDVFEHVRLYSPEPGVLLFLASDAPLDIERQMIRTGAPLNQHLTHYALMGLGSAEDFLSALALDEDGVRRFARGAAVSTDDDNRMATRSRSYGDGLNGRNVADVLKEFDPLLEKGSWVYRDAGRPLNFGYVGSRLLYRGFIRRANDFANAVPDRAAALLLHAAGRSFQGKDEDALRYLRQAIATRPDSLQARFALVKNQLGALVKGSAPEEIQLIADSLSGAPRAVVAGWRHAAARDWFALAQLEPRLAPSEPTDLWYPEATQLRVEWRTKVRMQDISEPLAFDALRLADRALVIAPELDLYVLRAAAGIMLKDPHVLVESTRYVATYIDTKLTRVERGEYELSDRELATMRSRLDTLAAELDSELTAPVAARADKVRRIMRDVSEKLAKLEKVRGLAAPVRE
jgi:predicted membrane-bound spermidine synthase